MPPGAHVQVLLSPTQGYDCYVMAQRIEPGARGPALHTHGVVQFYYVLAGRMSIQLGCDEFTAEAGMLVRVPAGTPHCTWNAASVDECHIELIAPGPPLASLSSPAQAHCVPEAEGMLWTLEMGEPHRDSHVDIELLNWPAGETRSLNAVAAHHVLIVLTGTLALGSDASMTHAAAPSLVHVRHGNVVSARNRSPETVRCLSLHVSPAV